MKRLLIALCVVLALPAVARRVDLTVIQTTDIHGHVLPTRDYDGNDNLGGMLRCSTLIVRIRAAHTNVLLVDCGDTIQGGAENYLTRGRIMMTVCESLRYDAWLLGNHEFDWGIDAIAALHDRTSLQMIGANIGVRAGGTNRLQKVKPFVVREMDGVRVVVVGLTTPGIPYWSRPELLGDQVFEPSVDALRRVMPEVRALSPDIVILAVHQGLRPQGDDFANQVKAICSAFPEIRFVLGGHTHKAVPHQKVGSALYEQAGYHGIWLGELDISYDTDARKVIEAKADAIHVDASVPEDESLRKLVAPDLDRAAKYLKQVVAKVPERLTADADEKGRSATQTLISRAIVDASGAEFAIHGPLTTDAIGPGELSMDDIWRIVPYENSIGVAQLTPGEMAAILDENLALAGTTHFKGIYGFDYDIETRDGARHCVHLRDAAGQPLHGRKRYGVAFNSYDLASGGRRAPELRRIADQPEARLRMVGVTTRDALIALLKKRASSDKTPSGALP